MMKADIVVKFKLMERFLTYFILLYFGFLFFLFLLELLPVLDSTDCVQYSFPSINFLTVERYLSIVLLLLLAVFFGFFTLLISLFKWNNNFLIYCRRSFLVFGLLLILCNFHVHFYLNLIHFFNL